MHFNSIFSRSAYQAVVNVQQTHTHTQKQAFRYSRNSQFLVYKQTGSKSNRALEEAFPSKRYHPFQLMPKKANVNSGFQSQAASRGSIVSRHRSSSLFASLVPLPPVRVVHSPQLGAPNSWPWTSALLYETSFCFWTAFGNGQQPDQGLRRNATNLS